MADQVMEPVNVEKAEVTLVVLVDANGDYAVGKDADAAREAYANDVGDMDSWPRRAAFA